MIGSKLLIMCFVAYDMLRASEINKKLMVRFRQFQVHGTS